MAQKNWFKNKKYGWGWTPASPEGWLVLLFFTLGDLAYPIFAVYQGQALSPVLFLGITFVLVFALILICFKKGEKPTWQWGDRKSQD